MCFSALLETADLMLAHSTTKANMLTTNANMLDNFAVTSLWEIIQIMSNY